MRDRISLDRQIGIFQKLEIDDVAGILKIDENADFLAGFGFKGGFQQSSEAEWRKNTGGNLLGDTHINDILNCTLSGATPMQLSAVALRPLLRLR